MTTTPIRDQIIAIVAGDQDPADRTDRILTAVADWLIEPGHDFRIGLALAEATPHKWEHGVHGHAELEDAARAVAIELSRTLRPKPPTPTERPTVADRYATLADDVNTVNTGSAL